MVDPETSVYKSRNLVIGGGNTALDVVRELVRLGVPDVAMVYRGTEERMSGYAHEWKAAFMEGVKAHWQTQPVEFVGDGGAVRAARCIKYDENKKPDLAQCLKKGVAKLMKHVHVVFMISDLQTYHEWISLFAGLETKCDVMFMDDLSASG